MSWRTLFGHKIDRGELSHTHTHTHTHTQWNIYTVYTINTVHVCVWGDLVHLYVDLHVHD